MESAHQHQELFAAIENSLTLRRFPCAVSTTYTGSFSASFTREDITLPTMDGKLKTSACLTSDTQAPRIIITGGFFRLIYDIENGEIISLREGTPSAAFDNVKLEDLLLATRSLLAGAVDTLDDSSIPPSPQLVKDFLESIGDLPLIETSPDIHHYGPTHYMQHSTLSDGTAMAEIRPISLTKGNTAGSWDAAKYILETGERCTVGKRIPESMPIGRIAEDLNRIIAIAAQLYAMRQIIESVPKHYMYRMFADQGEAFAELDENASEIDTAFKAILKALSERGGEDGNTLAQTLSKEFSPGTLGGSSSAREELNLAYKIAYAMSCGATMHTFTDLSAKFQDLNQGDGTCPTLAILSMLQSTLLSSDETDWDSVFTPHFINWLTQDIAVEAIPLNGCFLNEHEVSARTIKHFIAHKNRMQREAHTLDVQRRLDRILDGVKKVSSRRVRIQTKKFTVHYNGVPYEGTVEKRAAKDASSFYEVSCQGPLIEDPLKTNNDVCFKAEYQIYANQGMHHEAGAVGYGDSKLVQKPDPLILLDTILTDLGAPAK